MAKGLGMSYSFSTARRKKRLFQGERIECTSGMAILTGADTWMLYSGSFFLPETIKDRGRVAQFAVIRKNGNLNSYNKCTAFTMWQVSRIRAACLFCIKR